MPDHHAAHDADTVELLLFRLGGDGQVERSELFGIHVGDVREIVAMPAMTALAGAPRHLLGVVNLRGQVIHVLDLPALTGCVPVSGLNILLVTEFGAFAVEAVEEIVLLPRDNLVTGERGAAGGIVAGIARLDGSGSSARLAQVLDIDTIMNNPSGERPGCLACY